MGTRDSITTDDGCLECPDRPITIKYSSELCIILYYVILYIIVYYIIIMKVLFELTVKFCVKIIKYFYSLIKFKFFCVSVCFWPTHVADIPLRGCIERLQVCCVIRNDCKREDVPQWCVSCLYHRWLELNQGQFQCIVTATLSWAGTKISIASILYLRTAGGKNDTKHRHILATCCERVQYVSLETEESLSCV